MQAERIEVVGRGRMGAALVAALRETGCEVIGPSGRGADGAGSGIVLLAVPDAAIAAAAARIVPGPLLGHLSGATGLEALGEREGFALHPLLSVTGAGTRFVGAYAAVAGSGAAALVAAEELAGALGMTPFRVADADRAAYHAAASVAANFLVVLEGFAERLAATAGVPRAALAPLVLGAARNWAAVGAAEALTGPVARGDAATVARQRSAVAERTPERLALFDALVAATRELAMADPAPRD